MMETLIAIAVFGLGFVAVAAIFPAAATLQKKAAGDLLTQQVSRNVKAMLNSRKFSHNNLTEYNEVLDRYGPYYIQEYEPHNDPNDPDFDLNGDDRPNLEVQPLLKKQSSSHLLDPPGRLHNRITNSIVFERWMLNDRSYFFMRNNLGANAYHPQHAAELGDPYAAEFKRTFYWVPLIRRTQIPTGPSDWRVCVFILRRDDALYDRSSNTPATNAFSDIWANWDGFQSRNGVQYWYVPGVRSLTVTNVTNLNQFNFGHTNNNGWTGAGSGLEIVPGDLVLDSNGAVHKVLTADVRSITVDGVIPEVPVSPNRLWYARPSAAGRPSPTTEILILNDVVE